MTIFREVRVVMLGILLIFQFFYQGNSIPLDEFYPYGTEHGDDVAPTNDDGSTDPIPVSSLFPFFNHQHDSLIVNTNGVISFLGTMRTFTPSPFPLASKRRLIAPYWADIDTNNGGKVWFRETFDKFLLQKASEEIYELFPQYHNFQASWMFIATWDEVAFYGAHSYAQRKKKCTFQCLLVTNGRHSFTTFMYNKTEWTTGTASGGNGLGLGGKPAQVGFDAGDGMNYYALEASRTPQIINVTQMSNIDYPGKFIFRVDSTEIKGGGCNVEGTLTITPREATMMGGTRLIVSGPCFDYAKAITLHLSDGKIVPCELFTKQSASCISPTLYRTGKDIVVLQIVRQNDTELTFVGSLSFVNHGLTKHVIKRTPFTWKHNTEVTVSWNSNSVWTIFRNSSLKLELFEIKKEQDGQLTLEHHSNIASNVAAHTEGTSHTFNLNFNGSAGIIKLSSSEGGPYFWSDIFTVNVNRQHSQSVCDKWRDADGNKPEISLSDVTPCPCTLRVANIDISRFSTDPQCRNNNGERQCRYQPFAQMCFKLNAPTSLGYDSQCCYNENGLLMNSSHLYLHGTGFANRYHYMGDNGENIPYLSNFYHDIMPYQHCCLYQPDSLQGCTSFYDRRPPSTCMNYEPPRPAGVSGDPHFVTFDGQRYTFNPVGEFTAISSGNFTLQLRMEQVGNLPASSVTSLVARTCPNSDPIEVRGNSIRGIDVIVNGSNDEINWSEHDVIVFNGASIEKTSDDPKTIYLRFPAEDISINVTSGTTTNQTVLNLLIFSPRGTQQGNMTGLFGDNDGNSTNDFKTNDNVLVSENASLSSIHTDFGSSWRITEESSLFTYDGGRDFSSYQNRDFQPMFDVPDITEEAKAICGNNKDCQYDFALTQDRGFATLTAHASDTMAEVEETLLSDVSIESNPTSTSTTTTTTTTHSVSTTVLPTTASPTPTSPTTASPTLTSPATASPTTTTPTTTSPTTTTLATTSPTTSTPATASPTTTSQVTTKPTASPISTTITTPSPTTTTTATSTTTIITPTTTTSRTTSPTTAFPTTASPTTASSTTTPTTATPTTASPTTASPTTASPATATPTTVSPTTASPTTTTASPTTASRATQTSTKSLSTTSTTVIAASVPHARTTTAEPEQKTTPRPSSNGQLSDQSLLTTVMVTVTGSILVIGVIIAIIIACVVMARKYGRKRHTERKYKAKDLESISQTSDSADSFNFHIKRPLFRPDWLNLLDKQTSRLYPDQSLHYSYGEGKHTMNY